MKKLFHYIKGLNKMKNEDKIIRDLFKELPRETAPSFITQLIMDKVKQRKIYAIASKPLLFWQTQAFYIMIAIVSVEAWFLYSIKDIFTLSNIEKSLKELYIYSIQHLAIVNFNVEIFLTVIAIVGVLLYLFIKEQIENMKNTSRFY